MADMLVAMGYDPALADAAIKQCGGDVNKAVDYILSGSITLPPGGGGVATSAAPAAGRKMVDDAGAQEAAPPTPHEGTAAAPMEIEGDGDGAAADAAAAAPTAVPGAPKVEMLVCVETGKMFATPEQATRYAKQTGHQNFEMRMVDPPPAPKPLTEEEKKAKLEALKTKMREKRELKAAEEKAAEKEKEKLRRVNGAEQIRAQEAYKERQMAKLAAEKKRERAEEKAHRAKVKALLKQDELNRQAEKKARSEGGSTAAAPPAAAKAAPPAAPPPAEKKVYSECRVQLRPNWPGARPVTAKFPASDTVAAVFAHARASFPELAAGAPFELMMTRPRKNYTEGDAATPIVDSGLMPSAALTVVKK
mmetsp:Transcript_11681/g.29991  ORF Transcript_11681/g.29991 Transcript_11681/m.29991 type:complete len:363 (-) Transcript_11681:87-1175(-)